MSTPPLNPAVPVSNPVRKSSTLRFWRSRPPPAPSSLPTVSLSSAPATGQYKEETDWLSLLLLASKAVTAAADGLPGPALYVKAVSGTAVMIFETVRKVKKNREDLRELCESITQFMINLEEHLDSRKGSDNSRVEIQCENLNKVLKEVHQAVEKLVNKPTGFRNRIKEIAHSEKLTDIIAGYKDKIQELRNNFVVKTVLNIDRQVHKLGNPLSAVDSLQEHQRINNCPLPSRIFQGREAILEKIQGYFKCELATQHIYVLYGLGGTGKTQIALKTIELLDSHFSDIFFIDASSKETIAMDFEKLAAAKKTGSEAKLWLVGQKQPWLLFFDNADDPKLNLNEYFPNCNHGNILVTSRNPNLRFYAVPHASFSKVTDMEEKQASELLLKRAIQDDTLENQAAASEIVKKLHYLPLAIVQAGAFIAKSGDLEGYLSLYMKNKAQLLIQKPGQTSDSYAETVYTTWNISFYQLSKVAQQFLCLCSLIHHDGISEFIFKNASKYTFPSWGPSREELGESLDFLSHFQTASSWDSFKFVEVQNEIAGYSLLNYDSGKKTASIHPLVHDWCCSTITNQLTHLPCIMGIIGMCFAGVPASDIQAASVKLAPHVSNILNKGGKNFPDCRTQFAHVCYEVGNYQVAEQLGSEVLQKRRAILGDDHPDTLIAMSNLAATYRQLGAYHAAKCLEEDVLQKCSTVLGDAHPGTLFAMSNLAATHRQLGAYQEAKHLEEEVLEKHRLILKDIHPDTLAVMANLAATHWQLGAYQQAKHLNEEVLKKRKAVLGDTHPDTWNAMANLAATQRQLGAYQEAKVLEEEVLKKRTAVLGDTHPGTLFAMANLAATHRQLGAYQAAKYLEEEVLEKRKVILKDAHPGVLFAMANLAVTHRQLGAYEKAKCLEEEVLEQRKGILGDAHPDTLWAMANLAATYRQLGVYRKAKCLEEEVLEKRRAVLGNAHPDTLTAMANLAATHWQLGAYHKAKHLNEEVLKECTAVLGDAHPDTWNAMANLAATHHKLGAYQDAKHLEEEVLKKRRAVLGDAHPDTWNIMGNLAATHRELGAYEVANGLEEQVLQKRRAVLGDAHPDTLTAMANLATTRHQLGAYQEAKYLNEEVLKQRTAILGDEHPDTLTAMANLAATHRWLGKYQAAKDLEEEVLEKCSTILGDDHPDTWLAMSNLALTYYDLKLFENAKELQEAVVHAQSTLFGVDHQLTLDVMTNLANTYDQLGQGEEAGDLRNKISKNKTLHP